MPAKVKLSKNKIIVPYDFSSFSEAALTQAIYVAKIHNSSIDLIHIITPVYVGVHDTHLLPERDMFYSRLIKATEFKLKKISELMSKKHALKINVKSYLGIVHQAILKHSKKVKADLIVMGTHGVSGLKEFFLGSNAFRVVNESVCPVLTIQHKNPKPLFKKIMVVLTNDTSVDSLMMNVAKFAQNHQTEIIIVSHNISDKQDKDLPIKKMISSAEIYLKQHSIPVSILNLKESEYTKAVITNAKKSKADIIAVSTNKKFHFGQFMSGSFAQQLVNHSSIPTLSIP